MVKQRKKGLFVGLSTLDFIYLTEKFFHSNEKIVALESTITAGGPATNAAIAFSHLGHQAHLLSIIGNHPLSNLIKADLANYNLEIQDLNSQQLTSPPVSSIIVTQTTGDRAVISLNATKSQASIEQLPANVLEDVAIVLVDGHQMLISAEIARLAQLNNIPVVMDGGSWKEGWETVLPYVDYAICSANFYPPQCRCLEDVINYLQIYEIPHLAITQGNQPIIYLDHHQRKQINIDVIEEVDTLGAGDIFHGAFCWHILENDFSDSLWKASKIASQSCQYFGTRKWME